MSRPLAQLPTSVQLDNLTAVAHSLAGYYDVPASVLNHVIDLTKFDAGDGNSSIRSKVWDAIAGGVASGALSIDSTIPVLAPAYNYASVDGPGFGAKATEANALRPGLPGYRDDKSSPQIISLGLNAGSTVLIVTFNRPVYAAPGGNGPVLAADLAFRLKTVGGITAASLAAITKVGGGALTGGESAIECTITTTGVANGTEVYAIKPAVSSIVSKAPEKIAAVEIETDIVGVAP